MWACKLQEITVVHYYVAFCIMQGILQKYYMDTSCADLNNNAWDCASMSTVHTCGKECY